MSATKIKVYVGCALNNVDPNIRQGHIERVDRIKQHLRNADFEVLDFIGDDPNVSCEKVYERDIVLCKESHLMLALVDLPSTGLGFEIATKLTAGGYVLAMAESGASVSRMVRGISHGNFRFVSYDPIDERKIPELLHDHLKMLRV